MVNSEGELVPDVVAEPPAEDEIDDAVFGFAVTEVVVCEDCSSVTISDSDSLLPGFSIRVAISRDLPNLRASCCVMIFFFRCLDASAASSFISRAW